VNKYNVDIEVYSGKLHVSNLERNVKANDPDEVCEKVNKDEGLRSILSDSNLKNVSFKIASIQKVSRRRSPRP
jgi:hypothetical protein